MYRPSTYPPANLFTYHFSACLSVSLSLHMSVRSSINSSIHPCLFLSFCLPFSSYSSLAVTVRTPWQVEFMFTLKIRTFYALVRYLRQESVCLKTSTHTGERKYRKRRK